MIAQDAFRRGMRQFASSVSIVTTRHAGIAYGLTATAVCSLSVNPPALIVCVNRSASAHEPMCDAGIFCVNVLGEGQCELASAFAGGAAPAARFTNGTWIELATGAPALEEAVVCFDCTVVSRTPAQSHSIFVGLVLAGRQREQARPLLYGNGNYGSFASLAA